MERPTAGKRGRADAQEHLTLPKTPQKVHSLPAELTELETFCRETFGVRATITGNQKKGKITLQYYSAEELEQVYELLHQLHHD